MGPDSQSKDPHLAGVLDRGKLVIIMRILSLVREESGLAKRIRSLWSAIYWVSPRLEGIESICWVYGYKRVCFQGVNQKIIIGSIRLQLGKQALACPNVAGGSGGHSEPPLPQQGCYGAEPPRKNFKALNCIWIDLNWVQTSEINTFENRKISTNWRIITLSIFLIT